MQALLIPHDLKVILIAAAAWWPIHMFLWCLSLSSRLKQVEKEIGKKTS